MFLVGLFMLVVVYAAIFAKFFGLPLLLGWVCWRLFREKDGKGFAEGLLLVLTAALMGGAIWLAADYGIERRAAYDHMRAALIRCGEMLKNGEREALAQKLSAFVESPEMDSRLIPFTVAFEKAVGAEEPPPPERWEREALFPYAFWGGVCLVLIGIWAVMLGCGVEPRKRRGYLSVLAGLSLFGVILVSFLGTVRLGYTKMGLDKDVRRLAKEVARPEIPPELLPQLENPERGIWSYLENK